jgi:predicted TIM-barrel fold metal-dependent hydrolase
MPVIDADTHVDECDETWEHLEEADRKFKPITVTQDAPAAASRTPRGYNRYWLIDGQLRLRRIRDDKRTGTVLATRELQDIEARLRHMDALGVDTQVIYPTLFLMQVSGRPEVELALSKAYNRWMAAKWAQGKGRLRWITPLPLMSMDAALEELRFAKEHGACGVLKKGRECGNRLASDPYFFPLYEEANRLDMPICIHLGSGDPELTDAAPGPATSLLNLTLPVLDAFSALATANVPERFPKLRFGFIETTASWVPYLLTDMITRHERLSWLQTFNLKKDVLRENRFFVTCDILDHLPYILEAAGDSSFIIGSDYGHADMSAVIDMIQLLKDLGAKGHVNADSVQKILDNNPRAFYGL